MASRLRGSRIGIIARMTPGPQSIRIAVDAVSTSVPDAGVSGCGAEVPDPTIVTRVTAFLPDVASADRRTTQAPPSGLRRRSARRDYDRICDDTVRPRGWR